MTHPWLTTPVGGCDQEIRHLGSFAPSLWVENWVETTAAWKLWNLVQRGLVPCILMPDTKWLVTSGVEVRRRY